MTLFSDLVSFTSLYSSQDTKWANYLFDLGKQFAALESADKSINALVVLPTVELAAPLVAFGYIYNMFSQTIKDSNNLDFFHSLEIGSPLIYRGDEGQQHARFLGVRTLRNPIRGAADNVCVAVNFENRGNATHLLLPHQFDRIVVVSSERVPTINIGKEVEVLSPIFRDVYDACNDFSKMVNAVRLVGRSSEIEHEFSQDILKAKCGRNRTGSFNDLLHADQLCRNGDPSFISLYSCFGEHSFDKGMQRFNGLTILRDSESLLKHQHSILGNKISLVGMEDRHLSEAIGSYNQHYYYREDEGNFDLSLSIKNTMFSSFVDGMNA